MERKDLMILGIELGVLLFFIGIASNFALGETTITYRTPQQVSSFLKLLGMGIATLSILLGGIFINRLEMVTRVLLVVFGVVLLCVNIGIISLVPYY